MTTSDAVTAETVNTYLAEQATEAEIVRYHAAARQRRDGLGALRAAAVVPGSVVVIGGMKPKYLNGLRGTVGVIERMPRSRRVFTTLTLDEASTRTLRDHQRVPADTTHHEIDGIPLTCCFPQ
jgi:hypothetical protein